MIIFLMCTVVLCSLCAHSASSFFPDFHCSNGFDYVLSLSVVKFQTCTCVHHFVFLPGCLCGLYTWIDSNLLQPSSVSTERSFLPCQTSVNATKTPLCLSLCFKTLSSYDACSRKAVNLPLYQVLLSYYSLYFLSFFLMSLFLASGSKLENQAHFILFYMKLLDQCVLISVLVQ